MDAATAVATLLKRSRVTKSELSSMSGVSRSLIDDYLKGRRQPSVNQLSRLGESVGLRLDLIWAEAEVVADLDKTPRWARPNPAMNPPALTMEERAEALVRVVAVAMEMRRRPRGDLEFPPFRPLMRVGHTRH